MLLHEIWLHLPQCSHSIKLCHYSRLLMNRHHTHFGPSKRRSYGFRSVENWRWHIWVKNSRFLKFGDLIPRSILLYLLVRVVENVFEHSWHFWAKMTARFLFGDDPWKRSFPNYRKKLSCSKNIILYTIRREILCWFQKCITLYVYFAYFSRYCEFTAKNHRFWRPAPKLTLNWLYFEKYAK